MIMKKLNKVFFYLVTPLFLSSLSGDAPVPGLCLFFLCVLFLCFISQHQGFSRLYSKTF
jgi:hypothetical protein